MKTIKELLNGKKEYTQKEFEKLKIKPWEYEPDEYKFWYKNFPCELLRGPVGQLNGYIGVPVSKKMEKFGDKLNILYECNYKNFNTYVHVHGGLTYSKYKNGYLYLGFDTGHGGMDYLPLYSRLIKTMTMTHKNFDNTYLAGKSTYKTFRYVYEECTELVDQIYILLDFDEVEKYCQNLDDIKLIFKYLYYNAFCRNFMEINIL
jgi:hypothetical protein